MNKIRRRGLSTATLLTAALGIAAGNGHATPAEGAATIGYQARFTETATLISTDAGSMIVEDGNFKVKAADSSVLAGAELSFRVDDFVFPIAAELSGNSATLTPQFDMAHAVYRPVALPFEDKAPFKSEYDREVAAWSRMTSTISMGATIGTLVGGIGGAAVGCVLGGIAGAVVASATIVGLFGPFIPAAAVGCLGGIIAIGALGTIAGQLFVTAPVAIFAAVQYFTTVNSPFPGK
ncbi:hypothetical protein [Nocardia sp. XZ_19_369]|uniref:hypothetical protein n=1 Tax=Nocardia sp. XZ_19_369 TaxID=2769487 RepID=UPI001890A244|nr:hypothetical protein [Nocardia sp. XZ_19_369]